MEGRSPGRRGSGREAREAEGGAWVNAFKKDVVSFLNGAVSLELVAGGFSFVTPQFISIKNAQEALKGPEAHSIRVSCQIIAGRCLSSALLVRPQGDPWRGGTGLLLATRGDCCDGRYLSPAAPVWTVRKESRRPSRASAVLRELPAGSSQPGPWWSAERGAGREHGTALQ